MTRAIFKARLAKAARLIRHSTLAEKLDIDRSLLRNWLYRNLPPDLAVKALSKKLEHLISKYEV